MASVVVLSLSTDFGGQLDPGQLKKEIKEDGTISVVITDVSRFGDVISLYFAGSLTGSETTSLNTLVANHVPLTFEITWKQDLADADVTLTTPILERVYLLITPSTTRTLTVDSAANLVTDNPVKNEIIFCVINNSGTQNVQLVAGTGGSLTGNDTISPNQTAPFHVLILNRTPSSEIYQLVRG